MNLDPLHKALVEINGVHKYIRAKIDSHPNTSLSQILEVIDADLSAIFLLVSTHDCPKVGEASPEELAKRKITIQEDDPGF